MPLLTSMNIRIDVGGWTMQEKGQTVVLWVRARVTTSIEGRTAHQRRSRQKDKLIRGRGRCRHRIGTMDRLCLLDISHLNVGVRPQQAITRGAHDDTVASIVP